MTKITKFTSLFVALAVALALSLTGTAFAQGQGGCPDSNAIGNFKPSNLVGASFSLDGTNTTATYIFDSFVNRNPVDAVPGLIDYCVYPPQIPTSATIDPAISSIWKTTFASDSFSFGRQDGNPNNIPLDGTMGITVGTATWPAETAPASQTIVLHINDAAECDALYGGNPGTCFVLPGTGLQPLSVTKTANPTFEDKYSWTIAKAAEPLIVKQFGGTATFNYTIAVTYQTPTPGGWQLIGTITVSNPNTSEITVDVTDAVSNGGTCTVENGTNVTVPANSSVTLNYTCTYISAPNPAAGTNTATAGGAKGTALFDFGNATADGSDDCVNVNDSYAGFLGNVCVSPTNPTYFTYSRTVPVPQWDCVSYDNTATFTTNDTGATGSASQTVKVCGPIHTGALTMGFWQNKNGQAIITGGASTGGVCNSGTWLRQYAPFQDLSATATCSQVATYVTNVIKAANASGASMNAMLKAQMLATALDVYFSDPALGGNQIGARAPIGGVAIDLTLICTDMTCTAFEDSSSVFGGTPKTVLEMLAYAASQSNVGGSMWYGNVKSTQELAKDAFDAINNQKAFAP